MNKKLGSPEALRAAEAILGQALAAAQERVEIEGGGHYEAFKAVLDAATKDPTLAGAIIFAQLSYALDAVYRAEAVLS